MSAGLEILPGVVVVLTEHDAIVGHLDEWELEAALMKIVGAMPPDSLTLPQRRGAWADIEALRFQRPLSDRRWPWGIYWEAISGGTLEGAADVFSPDVTMVEDDILDHWKHRAAQCRHPALKARFADLAWEIGRFRRKQARHTDTAPGAAQIETELPVSLAQTAVDSLFDLVERGWLRDETEGWQLLSRALELSFEIGDTARANKGKSNLFSFLRRNTDAGLPNAWWQFDELVWTHRKNLQLTDQETDEVVGLLERVVAEKSCATDPARYDPNDVLAATERLVRWAPQNDRERIKQLIRRGGNAFEKAAQNASALTAASWLENLLPIYRAHGLLEDAARLERTIAARASEAHGELKRLEVPIEIPKEEFDDWVENTAGETLEDGIYRIAARCLIKEQSTKENLRKMTRNAPLVATQHSSIIGSDGFTVATVGSIEKDLEGRALQHAANLFNWHAPWLNAALLRLRQRHGVDAESLLRSFKDSPVFPESRLPLLREGFAAWLANDPVKAVHVLVPQVEAAVRDLVAASGVSVRRFRPELRGFQVVGLSELLRQKVWEGGLLQDVRFHMIALYSDPRGINLRNIVAHGLAAADFIGPGSVGLANWVVHSIFLLRAIRIVEVPRSSTQ
jgi:uncharacterized protein DUF4209